MRPSALAENLKQFYAIGRHVHIEGKPGAGKTQIVSQVARDLGVGFIHIHGPLMQPEDMGMPVITPERTSIKFVVPEKLPMVGYDHPDQGILLIDEMSQADNSIQKIMANLIQERELHGYKLMPGWVTVSTGNRQQDRAGANKILGHLANRMTIIEIEEHLEDWCAWAMANNIDPGIVAFLRFKTQLLCDYDPQRASNPTPRSWAEGVSPIIGKVSESAEFECFKGAVGEGAAAEFMGFLKIMRQLPNIDLLLKAPDKADVPDDPATLYAIAGSIAHRSSVEMIEKIVTYAKRMPPEFMTLVMRDCLARCRDVTTTKAYIDWVSTAGANVILGR